MTDALLILNARDVAPAKHALSQLPIPKIWLTGYTECELADGAFDDAIRTTRFDRYLVVSDDIIIRPHALDAVLDLLDEGAPVATGYSQRTHTEWTVNLTWEPLSGDFPDASAYRFIEYRDAVSWPKKEIPTWFAGFSLTGMSRDLWLEFPFGCFSDGDEPGYASDFHLSHRLQEAAVPIVAAREGFAYHWRNRWQNTNDPDDDRVLIGELVQRTTVEYPETVPA